MDGDLMIIEHPRQHYSTLFNKHTGLFIRKEDKEWPEPLWSEDGPELIDLSITNYCERGCAFCYRKTSSKSALFIGLKEVESIANQAEACGTFQIALGGGNPNQHPDFIRILQIIREHNIVPSYTSNGDGLTDSIIEASAKYCGAVAISVYPQYNEDYYTTLLHRIKQAGVRVNLHSIIRNDTLDMWIKWLKEPPSFFDCVNAVIFLNYKPQRNSIEIRDLGKIERFFDTVNNCSNIKIGFDSCSISGIVRWLDVPTCLVEPCEAARFSAFISEDMRMFPCSFMAEKEGYGDLRKQSLIQIWHENEFILRFRKNELPRNCMGCEFQGICKGGCRLYPEINFC